MDYIQRYTIRENEYKDILELIHTIKQQYRSIEDLEFLIKAGFLAQSLPSSLREFLHNYKQYEDIYPVCIISGYKIDDSKIGKSPDHWEDKTKSFKTLEEEIFFILCASLVGNPIAWSTQQDGHIVHEVFPIKKHENDQLGFSSKEYLAWHTEDAFHPLRGDYLVLLCIRNPTKTPTMIASNTEIDLTQEVFKPLFKEIFKIKPDNSHLQKLDNDTSIDLKKANKEMQSLNSDPPTVPVLFGNPKSPFWRVDPYFMEIPENKSAREALGSLISIIEKNLKGIILQPGDIFFCNNYRVVHGRDSFVAKYNGWDRWLKRLNIVIDLRKSRAVRNTGTSRVFY